MPRRARSAQACILVLLVSTFQGVSGAPTIEISSPGTGQILPSCLVNVTGTAAGSDDQWTQTSQADFEGGTASGVTVNADGSLSLGRFVHDDFDDNSLDRSKWTELPGQGLTLSEEGKKLRFYGAPVSMAWTGLSALSNDFISNDISADLVSISGSGNGYSTTVGFFQDTANGIVVGEQYDWTWGYKRLVVAWISAGVPASVLMANLDSNPVPHTFGLKYNEGTVYAYMDGNQVHSRAFDLSKPKLILSANSVDRSRFDTSWDNVKAGSMNGTFTSAPFDTACKSPKLLKVEWNATLAAGNTIEVWLRSANRSDLADATPWTKVANEQSSGLPASHRHVQYQVRMARTDVRYAASFKDITLTFNKPVAKVEVSLDQASWVLAKGTENWWALLDLPEDNSTIYARVTDATGEAVTVSVRVRTDTTPPEGAVVINDGEWATLSRRVRLSLQASDLHGVKEMMVSEDPGFEGAAWEPFKGSLSWDLSLGDGNKTVHARFKDANGWISAPACDTILLDTTPPRGSVVINGGAAYTSSTSVRLAIEAEDLLGVVEMKLSGREDFTGADWRAFSPAGDWTLQPGNGERTVHLMFRNPLGQTSAASSDSIVLDTAPPSASLSLNGGARYAASRNITVALNATDNMVVSSMALAEGEDLAGAVPEPYRQSLCWTLSEGEGEKRLSARVWDAAGNPAPAASASIVLDITAPVSSIAPLPAKVADFNITVSWSGVDAVSGVESFDVSYRVEGGLAFTAWLGRTNATSAVFRGEDGKRYSFAVRSRDRAGNLEPFPGNASGEVLVGIPLPVVTITEPFANASVRGRLVVRGTAYHPHAGSSIHRVLVQLDGGSWELGNGTGSWTFELDTRGLKNGPHVLRAKAFDGMKESAEEVRTFKVSNPGPEPRTTLDSALPSILALLVILAVVGGLAAYRLGQKRRGG